MQGKSELHRYSLLIIERAQKKQQKECFPWGSVSWAPHQPDLQQPHRAGDLPEPQTSPTCRAEPATNLSALPALQAHLRSHRTFHIFPTVEIRLYSFHWRCGQHNTHLLHQQMRWWICCRNWSFQGKLLCCQCRYPTYLSSSCKAISQADENKTLCFMSPSSKLVPVKLMHYWNKQTNKKQSVKTVTVGWILEKQTWTKANLS